jgi:glycosyltransferase involved in cell wall biosynthesis
VGKALLGDEEMKVLAVSDVSIGYGSSQIPSIVQFLGDLYNAEKIIIEPDQIERPSKKDLFPNIKIQRIITNTHPHSPGGRIEYVLDASKLVEKIKPDILIICTTFTLPVLFKINFRPKKVIYYSLEAISHYTGDLEMNQIIDSKVDLIVFPEENRAAKHIEITKTKVPTCIVYNCTNSSQPEVIPVDKRNGKILYSGGLHTKTAYEYFLNDKLQQYPIDLYGLVEDPSQSQRDDIQRKFLALSRNVKYKGYLSANKLREIRKYYLYSLVIWLPVDENTTYACPNKFFEALSNGIPPITAPHPQGKMICKRYDCGIVMEDFSFESFLKSIKFAMEIEKPRYQELVNNCIYAVTKELHWEKQMDKVVNMLGVKN